MRAARQSAYADLLATREDARAVALLISTQVAAEYFTLAALRRQQELLHETIGFYENNFAFVEGRYRRGTATSLDLYQASTILAAAQAQAGDEQRLAVSRLRMQRRPWTASILPRTLAQNPFAAPDAPQCAALPPRRRLLWRERSDFRKIRRAHQRDAVGCIADPHALEVGLSSRRLESVIRLGKDYEVEGFPWAARGAGACLAANMGLAPCQALAADLERSMHTSSGNRSSKAALAREAPLPGLVQRHR